MRPIVRRVVRRYGATNVRVFGSFARGEQEQESDLDLLVSLPPEASLLVLAGMKVDLEEQLARKVDVLTDDSLSPYLRDRILREAVPL